MEYKMNIIEKLRMLEEVKIREKKRKLKILEKIEK